MIMHPSSRLLTSSNHPVSQVPGCEGRAGMAAVADPDHTMDVSAYHASLGKLLPPYAVPVFLRVLSEIDTTGRSLQR